jgi:hypothetical protein
MIISRNIISNNFRCGSSDKHDLVEKINLWKHILVNQCEANKGESVLIGLVVVNIDYLAICIAAAELSLRIVVVDYNRSDDFKDIEFYDSKTTLLSPIDIFLHDIPSDDLSECNKHNFFVNCSNRSYNIHEDLVYQTPSSIDLDKLDQLMPSPQDVILRCTSSGTTGTPKIVEHTHEFMAAISTRNSKKFKGKCIHIKNLNHGSSIAVYLLPSMISNDVTEHVFYDVDEDIEFDGFVNDIEKHREDLEYIIFPYPYMIDKFIEASVRQSITWPLLNVQTLSYIQDSAKQAIKERIFNSITSIFGSNETSGAVVECYIDKDCVERDSSYFSKIDDFYKIDIKENNLIGITLPYYNQEIVTNDVFEIIDGHYVHKGRNDLIKIDGEIIDIRLINDLNKKYENAYLVTDSVMNCLYLAFWNKVDIEIYEEISNYITDNFKKVKINKMTNLNKKSFMSGIKLDNELIREYFRKHV